MWSYLFSTVISFAYSKVLTQQRFTNVPKSATQRSFNKHLRQPEKQDVKCRDAPLRMNSGVIHTDTVKSWQWKCKDVKDGGVDQPVNTENKWLFIVIVFLDVTVSSLLWTACIKKQMNVFILPREPH